MSLVPVMVLSPLVPGKGDSMMGMVVVESSVPVPRLVTFRPGEGVVRGCVIVVGLPQLVPRMLFCTFIGLVGGGGVIITWLVRVISTLVPGWGYKSRRGVVAGVLPLLVPRLGGGSGGNRVGVWPPLVPREVGVFLELVPGIVSNLAWGGGGGSVVSMVVVVVVYSLVPTVEVLTLVPSLIPCSNIADISPSTHSSQSSCSPDVPQ